MFETQIKAGMEWAASKDPVAFATVDPDALDMGSGIACVLGQMFEGKSVYVSGFDWACQEFPELDTNGDCAGVFTRGFMASDADAYPRLTAEWQEALKARVPA